MRIVLETTSGPRSGHKVRLGAGQEVKVGRTEWADFSLAEDGHMSGVHFALETDSLACYLIDLESSNGTFLNGQQVPANTKITLGNGDEILAGKTSFLLHVEGEPRRQPAFESAQSPTLASAETDGRVSGSPNPGGTGNGASQAGRETDVRGRKMRFGVDALPGFLRPDSAPGCSHIAVPGVPGLPDG